MVLILNVRRNIVQHARQDYGHIQDPPGKIPEDEAKQYCTESIHKCSLTYKEYIADERAGVKDFGDHFRQNYRFRKVKDDEYFYQVISPSTH